MKNWIFEKIELQGDFPAIVYDNNEYSYTELNNQINKYYSIIKNKIFEGKTVAIISDYNFNSISLFFALYKNRNIIVPITTKVENEILEKIVVAKCDFQIKINDDALDIIDCDNNYLPYDLTLDLINKGMSGLILFSSGSTGKPKAMIHNLDNLIDSYSEKKGKKLVFLIFLMFDHIGGLNTMLNCISMGITMVFPSDRNPDHVCSLIEKYGVNILPASPTFLNLILISESHLKYNLSSLRMITYGTEPMPQYLLEKLQETFKHVKFLQTFGTSETGITNTTSKSSNSTFIKLENEGTEFKIVDDELWLKSKTQILGYLNESMERFTDDGWFKTGDLVERTSDGYIKIIGRNKEMINVGGEKVLPIEVESLLLQIDGVNDCIVYGESNAITGQMVVAKVLFDKEIKPSEAKKLIHSYCSGKIEEYKIPVKVKIMQESEFSERFKKKRIN